jgi:hypothetical protein
MGQDADKGIARERDKLMDQELKRYLKHAMGDIKTKPKGRPSSRKVVGIYGR